jgi:hydrogenase maturation protein HypF
MKERLHITVHGTVQGVGFRPYVYGLATKNGLAGFVLNDTTGVKIELEGELSALQSFLRALRERPPPLASVERIVCRVLPLKGGSGFEIAGSRVEESRQVRVAPDTAACDDCLRELFDPSDRRYRYPFINCTSCGPRFTITKDVPYDRKRTTMSVFRMCVDCAHEYRDPSSRRFHAQPNACPRCGPRATLLDVNGREVRDEDPISRAAQLLRTGNILAVKGMGGYHLACDAFDDEAVARLRRNKRREDKPFALMAPDLDAVRELCFVDAAEEALLRSRRRPIVLLRQKQPDRVAHDVAPGNRYLGIMLPYTPLHHLLLADTRLTLVMTSGNLSEEPIAYRDGEALQRLGGIADAFLMHDRGIHMRCDDSVTRVVDKRELIVRRSRGYAPEPIRLAVRFAQPVLACGAHLKNTFCLGKDGHAVLSHHIGDLENYETLSSFAEGVEHFKRLFDIEPSVVSYDLHPEYLSTQYALGLESGAKIGVQHHHAHIASCMAENGLAGPVIGVAFDGLGYGTDGAIWGGEFLIADLAGYKRAAHFRYVPLAGGDTAIRQPWRAALSYTLDALGKNPISLKLPGWEEISPKKLALVSSMMRQGLNTVRTSSCGRLFDAVASILGLRHEVNFEGQAAIELEMASLPGVEGAYPFEIHSGDPSQIDMGPAIAGIVGDAQTRLEAGFIAAKFHNTLIAVVLDVCRQLRQLEGLKQVCLSGGCFQNMLLLQGVVRALEGGDFAVYRNHRVPPNDGGIALGQAVVANEKMRQGALPG